MCINTLISLHKTHIHTHAHISIHSILEGFCFFRAALGDKTLAKLQEQALFCHSVRWEWRLIMLRGWALLIRRSIYIKLRRYFLAISPNYPA